MTPSTFNTRIVALRFFFGITCGREDMKRFTDTEKYFVSEASVYRILKSYDLITSPAYVVLSAADEFQ
ncbi:IS3 family transposase, partial [Ruegeria sp. 2012CJ41-6]|nr:IS3 family transposase [Ruegeria spongiae]